MYAKQDVIRRHPVRNYQRPLMKLFRQSESTSSRSVRCVSCNRNKLLQFTRVYRSQQQAAADALALHHKQALSQQKEAQIQLMRTEALLGDRSVKFLFAQGQLNVRGVIEWLAEDNSYRYFTGSDPGRDKVGEAILANPYHQGLEQCLVRATGKQNQKDKKLHLDISDIYQNASNHWHNRISQDLSTVVDIVKEERLLPKQAQMMVCICKHFGIPYKYNQIIKSLG